MEPIIFNASKHHLPAMAEAIREYAKRGEAAEQELMDQLIPGDGVTDIYDGKLSPDAIAAEVYEFLKKNNLLGREEYQRYLESQGDTKRCGYYASHTLSDGTVLTLRSEGFYTPEDRSPNFVHIHPGRYAPNTFRVSTNRLKTVLMAYFLGLARNTSPYTLEIINEARIKVKLSPIKKLEEPTAQLLRKLEGKDAAQAPASKDSNEPSPSLIAKTWQKLCGMISGAGR